MAVQCSSTRDTAEAMLRSCGKPPLSVAPPPPLRTRVRQVAVVDSNSRVVVFDVLSKEVVFQESGASRYIQSHVVTHKARFFL